MVAWMALVTAVSLGAIVPHQINTVRDPAESILRQLGRVVGDRPLLTNDSHEIFLYHMHTSASLVYTQQALREAWDRQPEALFLAIGALPRALLGAGQKPLLTLYDFPKPGRTYHLLEKPITRQKNRESLGGL